MSVFTSAYYRFLVMNLIILTSILSAVDGGHRDRFHKHESTQNLSITDRHGKLPEHNMKLFSVHFSHVQFPFILCGSLFILAVAKLGKKSNMK